MNAVWMKKTEKYEYAYHAVCWGVSFVISCLPFYGDHYGPAGMWCWIVDDWQWRFGIWYCPLFFIILVLFFTYSYIIISIKRKVKTWEGLYDPDVERKKIGMLLCGFNPHEMSGTTCAILVSSLPCHFITVRGIASVCNPNSRTIFQKKKKVYLHPTNKLVDMNPT